MEEQTQSKLLCPYLGLKKDPNTSISYPSAWNICHRAKGNSRPIIEYQRSTCLTSHHVDCIIYKSDPNKRMPKNIRQSWGPVRINPKHIIRIFTILLLCLLVFLGIKYQASFIPQIEAFFVPAWQQTQQVRPTTQPTQPTQPIILPTETQQPTFTATTTPTLQITPSPTITIEPSVLALDTPIGSENKFIILRVKEGAALGQFATLYNTTEAAIRAVNFELQSVLFIDSILIVPIDLTDVSGLPAFEAVEIQAGGMTIEYFAQQNTVSPEDLYLYNNVQPGRILQIGEWLLVPRE
jgi:hypothetical protein